MKRNKSPQKALNSSWIEGFNRADFNRTTALIRCAREAIFLFEEDFENLNEDEEERLKDRFTKLEERLDQLELETGDGHHALTNQKRLMYYLNELCRILESELGVELPDPPSLEE